MLPRVTEQSFRRGTEDARPEVGVHLWHVEVELMDAPRRRSTFCFALALFVGLLNGAASEGKAETFAAHSSLAIAEEWRTKPRQA